MKGIKRFLSGILVALGCISSGAHAQGIPVIDASNLAQSIQQVTAWAQQLKQMENQLNQLQSQYSAITSNRGFGSLLNNPTLQNYLPSDWQNVYSSVRSGGYSGLTGAAQSLRNASAIYNCQDQTGAGWGSNDTSTCNRALNKNFQDKAYAQQAYQSSMDRMTQIQGLISQIQNTQDPKGIAELQARIAGEQAALNDEQTKLGLFKQLSEAEDKLIQQQQHETDMQRVSATARTADSLQPVSY
jgi:type IV secretion system protein VirB5